MATEKIMENAGQITDIREFASALRQMLQQEYPSASVGIHEVAKNNNRMRTGILIRDRGRNISPTIYLEELFGAYRKGEPLDEICRIIGEIYQGTAPMENFDTSSITDFAAVKGKICYELINAEKNTARLQDMPHRLWKDLAIVYYVLLSAESAGGIPRITVTNGMMGLWGVDEHTLYGLASRNTPVLLRAEVMPMSEVIKGMLQEMPGAGEDIPGPLDAEELENVPPLYVATNDCKYHGAAVLLYGGVLERFAEQAGSDFYILPSSVHETLFLTVSPDKDGHYLSRMVRGINAEQVAPEEVLSDNVYLYHADDGSVTLVG